MRSDSGGYLLVLADRRSAWAGVRVRVSRFEGTAWLARARGLARRGRRIAPALKLLSCDYVDDPGQVRAQLSAALGPRFAECGRVRKGRLQKALPDILAADRQRLEARFDPATSLFRTPGDALPRPAKRLVARLAAQVVARTPVRRRTLPGQLRRAYALGLLWPLLGERLRALALPERYRPEVYRALVRALAGRHFTNARMADVLVTVVERPAEFRVGEWEYERFARRPAAGGPPGLDRFAFYLLEPRDHMRRGLADYRRRVHGALPVRVAVWTFRVLQVSMLGAAGAAIAWLILRAQGGLMPGLTLLFAVGAAIPAWRLYRRPDMARLMGHVSEAALEDAQAGLQGIHPYTLEPLSGPARPGAPIRTPDPAPVMPVPHGAEQSVPQPADIPAPVPVCAPAVPYEAEPEPVPDAPAPRAAGGEGPSGQAGPSQTPFARAESARAAAAAAAGMREPAAAAIAEAFIDTPLGPIPFPVPRVPLDDEPVCVRTDRKTDDDGVADYGFALGWSMPIPVPNWMAATAPEPPAAPAPEPTREVKSDMPPPPPLPETAARTSANPKSESQVFHAPPLPPVLPSAAFWGIESAGLRAGSAPRPGAGDGSRRGDS